MWAIMKNMKILVSNLFFQLSGTCFQNVYEELNKTKNQQIRIIQKNTKHLCVIIHSYLIAICPRIKSSGRKCE